MISYSIPTKIKIGSINLLLPEIDKLNPKSILLLSSPSISKLKSISNFIEFLSEKYSLELYLNIKPNAPVLPLEELCRNISKPELIIGIGGGSVIDSAKALSLCWQNASISELFYKNKVFLGTKIFTIVAPTTAGTGAELSYGAILYDEGKKIKNGIRSEYLQPDLVVLDITLYENAPKKLLAEAGFDCLTHAIETYISTQSTPLIRYQSIAAIQNIFKNLPKAIQGDRLNLEKVALSATLMGVNLAHSTTCLPHRIQYIIGPLTNTSHAQGLIVLYRGWLLEISKTRNFWCLADDLSMSIQDLNFTINELKMNLEIDYRLSEFGINSSQISAIAHQVNGNLENDPSYKSIETIINILENSL